MEYYPFIKCIHPRKIHNPYNHQDMIVPCGNCEACNLRKSSMNTMRVQMESQMHQYCRFITLTYSNDYIPRMCLVENDSGDYEIYDDEYFNQIGTLSSYQLKDYITIANKCDSQDVPFLRKYDLQKFIKRLRKYFDTHCINHGKIRYFACGEYGPKHFRPHYHIILWTSCQQIAHCLSEAVSSCWKFGRESTEVPFHDVSSYVARYVNGNCPLPSLLKLPDTRPFCVHSLHLGEGIFQESKEEIYKSPFAEITQRSCFINGSFTDVSMWRSLKTYYFPRCKEYDLLSSSERYEAYTIVKRIYEKYPERKTESLVSLTEFVLRLLSDNYERYGYIKDDYFRSLADYIGVDWCFKMTDKSYNTAFRSLYMILRTSKHFLDFVCDGNMSYINTHSKLRLIEEFWKDNELYNLNNRYQCIEENFDEIFECEEEYQYLFTMDIEKICNTKVFNSFRSERMNLYRRSMKRKTQNDLNRVFEQI